MKKNSESKLYNVYPKGVKITLGIEYEKTHLKITYLCKKFIPNFWYRKFIEFQL